MSTERESVRVLKECIELQIRKSQDYQNPNSNVKQADHYRRGVSTIHDMISQKLLRAQSLLEPLENGEIREANFESIEDTYKDLINYASFAVAYIRGEMEGQDKSRDMLNRLKQNAYQSELIGAAKEFIDRSKNAVLHPMASDLNNAKAQAKDVGDRIEEDFNSISHWGVQPSEVVVDKVRIKTK